MTILVYGIVWHWTIYCATLGGTVDHALVIDFSHSSEGCPVTYADSAYGDDQDDRKSTNGHVMTVMLIGNTAMIWSSEKQRCTVTSTTVAEYISMCQASKDLVWATRWIEEVGFDKSLEMPIRLCGDNKGALDLVKTRGYPIPLRPRNC